MILRTEQRAQLNGIVEVASDLEVLESIRPWWYSDEQSRVTIRA